MSRSSLDTKTTVVLRSAWLLCIASAACLFAFGCFSEENPHETKSGKPFVMDEDGFQKFERPYVSRDLIREAQSTDVGQFSQGRIASKRARAHMVPNGKHNQFALYEHEAFVLDIVYLPINLSISDYHIRVLANFESVPFQLISVPVDSDFPAMNSENSGVVNASDPDTRQSFDVQLRDSVANAFTVVIPADSFSWRGAIDLRVLMSPKVRSQGGSEPGQYRDADMSFSVTLYREGGDFPKLRDTPVAMSDFERDEQFLANQRTLQVMQVGFSRSVLLPSREGLNDDVAQLNLKQRFPIDTPHSLVALYFADWKWSSEPQDVVSTLLVNGDLTDRWKASSQVNRMPLGAISEDETASVRTFELSELVDDEVSTLFVVFERPLKDHSEVSEFESLIGQSNPLLLGSKP